MTDIYFPVRKVPVEEITPGFEHPPGINHAIVVTKPDGVERVVQYCSEIYSLVPNDSIIPLFQKEISKFFKVETKIKMSKWSQFFVDFIVQDKSLFVGKEDKIFPQIRIINSYDGSIKFNYQAGFHRLICENGLTIPHGQIRSIKSMHTPKIGNETSFEAVMEMLSEFMAEAGDIVELYDELNDQVVKNWMLRIEEVTEETAFPSSLMEIVTERMGTELDMLNVVPNDWLIYNAFNYQLNHNLDYKAKQNKKDSVDQEVLEYLLKY